MKARERETCDELGAETIVPSESLSSTTWAEMLSEAAFASRHAHFGNGSESAELQRKSNEAGLELKEELRAAFGSGRLDSAKMHLELLELEEREKLHVERDNGRERSQGALIGPESTRLDAAGIRATQKYVFDDEANDAEKILAIFKLAANNKSSFSSPDGMTYNIVSRPLQDGGFACALFQEEEERCLLQGVVDRNGRVVEAGDKKTPPSANKIEPQDSRTTLANERPLHAAELQAPPSQESKGKNFETDENGHGGKDAVSLSESDRSSGKESGLGGAGLNAFSGLDSAGIDASTRSITQNANVHAEKPGSQGKDSGEQTEQTAFLERLFLGRSGDNTADKLKNSESKKFRDQFPKGKSEGDLIHESQQVQERAQANRLKKRQAEKELLLELFRKSELDKSERKLDARSSERRTKTRKWTERLKAEAGRKLSGEELKEFLQNLERFEDSAEKNGLSAKEVEATMKHLSKLLSAAVAFVAEADRSLAVRSFVEHLADPNTCDQGHHNTCNVSTLTLRNTRRQPGKMAEMLKSALLTGLWTAPDRKKIRLSKESLIPGGEEQYFPHSFAGERTYANQILNNVLVNDISQRRVPPEFYAQEKPQSIDDCGERLRYADGSEVDKDPPAIHVEEMDAAQKRLTGETKFIIYNAYFKSNSDDLVPIKNQAELALILASMADEQRLPAVLYVDTRHSEFGGDGSVGDGQVKAHVVSITSYNAETGKAMVTNQWGPVWNREYSLAELYRSSLPVEQTLWK